MSCKSKCQPVIFQKAQHNKGLRVNKGYKYTQGNRENGKTPGKTNQEKQDQGSTPNTGEPKKIKQEVTKHGNI